MNASDFDLNEMRRRAQALIDWDGGRPLPSTVPPEAVVAMVDELAILREAGPAPSVQKGHKLQAWMIEHNAHGESYNTPVWLPEGDKPETKELWVRAPWLDGSRSL